MYVLIEILKFMMKNRNCYSFQFWTHVRIIRWRICFVQSDNWLVFKRKTLLLQRVFSIFKTPVFQNACISNKNLILISEFHNYRTGFFLQNLYKYTAFLL